MIINQCSYCLTCRGTQRSNSKQHSAAAYEYNKQVHPTKSLQKNAPLLREPKKNPLELKHDKGWAANKWVEFKIPSKDTKAKFGIRVDAVEFDTSFNPIFLTETTTFDHYEDNLWDANASDIKKSTPVDVVIREAAARLTFMFTISPID